MPFTFTLALRALTESVPLLACVRGSPTGISSRPGSGSGMLWDTEVSSSSMSVPIYSIIEPCTLPWYTTGPVPGARGYSQSTVTLAAWKRGEFFRSLSPGHSPPGGRRQNGVLRWYGTSIPGHSGESPHMDALFFSHVSNRNFLS